MYSLDINFLKDRSVDTAKTTTGPKLSGPSLQKQFPILIGAGVMVLLPALAGSLLLLLGYQTTKTQENIAVLDQQLGELNSQNQRIADIEGKISGIDQEIKSLVGVFNQIKPWSALLEEIARQIPPPVQVASIQQEGPKLTIAGTAANYGDLNDFLLTLQNSKFLKADLTKLVSASLKDSPIAIQNAPENIEVILPKVVNYSITTELTDAASSNLQRELASRGAVGLVTRIQTLQQKGVLQP